MKNWKQEAYNLLAQKKAALEAADAAWDEKNMEEYDKKMAEAQGLDGAIQKAMNSMNQQKQDYGMEPQEDQKGQNPQNGDTVTKSFATAIRNGIQHKAMTEGTGANGGYTVPVEIETQVRQWREATAALRDLTYIHTVNTASGEMTYQTRGEATGFVKVDETGKIQTVSSPSFERIKWSVDKYPGVMAASNELLDDSDANIRGIVTDWLGRNLRSTENTLILSVLQGKEATDLQDLDGIRTALNVTLGSTFKPYCHILTNDSGLNYLDNLKDGVGRQLLSPDPTNAAKLQLRAGNAVIPVDSVPDSVLKNDESKIPFIIGSFQDAVMLNDRKGMEILPSNTASVGDLNAFENDLTLFRAITRFSVQALDETAWVNGYIDTAAVTAAVTADEGANVANDG